MSRKPEPDAPRRYDPDGRAIGSIITGTARKSHGREFGKTSRMFYGRRWDTPLEVKFVPRHDHIVSRPDRPKAKDSHVHVFQVRGVSVTRIQSAAPRTPAIIARIVVTDGSIQPRTLEALTESWVQSNPSDFSGEYVSPIGQGWDYSE
jgi:hypothetical protein